MPVSQISRLATPYINRASLCTKSLCLKLRMKQQQVISSRSLPEFHANKHFVSYTPGERRKPMIIRFNAQYLKNPYGCARKTMNGRLSLGYNEDQYSLERWQDLSVSRQSLYDRIYVMIPTAGWMFLPLTVYHGGGAAAQIEPLSEHITAYKFGLAQYLGAGVAACYRGYRLYDSEETKDLVKEWVSFYKKYRDILTSDIVRVRRPDMQSIDSYMHVNYKLENKGLVMVFNPTLEHKLMNLTLPLYYTGIKKVAAISEKENGFVSYSLDMSWEVEVFVELPPREITWFLIKDAESGKR